MPHADRKQITRGTFAVEAELDLHSLCSALYRDRAYDGLYTEQGWKAFMSIVTALTPGDEGQERLCLLLKIPYNRARLIKDYATAGMDEARKRGLDVREDGLGSLSLLAVEAEVVMGSVIEVISLFHEGGPDAVAEDYASDNMLWQMWL